MRRFALRWLKCHRGGNCHMSRSAPFVVTAGIALVMAVTGAAEAASKCTGEKAKAAGKKAAAKLTCLSKGVGKALPQVDSTCIAKAEVKFSVAYAKAEAK